MTSQPKVMIGISLDEALLSVVVAVGGQIRPEPVILAPAVAQSDGRAVAGDGVGSRSDVLRRMGERALVPLHDTYFPVDHLLGVLLGELRRRAEWLADHPVDGAAIAYPSGWDQRCRQLLLQAAQAAGLPGASIWPTHEAAAWAPVGPPEPAGGLVLVVDLGAVRSVALLEPTEAGPRLAAHVLLDRNVRPGDASRDLVTDKGASWTDIRDVRAIGTEAADPRSITGLEQDLGLPVRVPDRPAVAAAVGALHRALEPVSQHQVFESGLDITEQLRRFAVDREARGDAVAGRRARVLAQEIFEFRMGIHPPAATTAFPAVMREAAQLVEGT